MKKFEKYDPKTRYFGPQGSPLSQYIHIGVDIMPINLDLRKDFNEMLNRAGYEHDKAYHGTRRGGFFGLWIDELARRQADKRLRNAIKYWAYEYREWMDELEFKAVLAFAKATYHSIRKAGWVFFRTGEDS